MMPCRRDGAPHDGTPSRWADACAWTRVLFAAIALLALGIRIAFWWGQWRHNPFFLDPTMDEAANHAWAQQVASGEGLGAHVFFRAPLYPCVIGGLYACIGPHLALARLLGCVLGALTCTVIARLGVAVGGFRTGVAAGVLAACYWPLVYADNALLSVGLEVFLNALFLLLLVEAARRDTRYRWLGAGLVLGLSAVTRPTALVLSLLVPWWSFAGPPPERGRRRPLRAMLLAGLGVALIVAPVTLRNRMVGGEWVLIASNGGVNFFIGNHAGSDGVTAVVPGTRPGWMGGYEDTHHLAQLALGHVPTEGEVSAYWYQQSLQWIRTNPRDWLALLLWKLRLFWSPVEIMNNQAIDYFVALSGVSVLFYIGFPVVACLGAAGVVMLRGSNRAGLMLVPYVLLTMASIVAFFCSARYRLPVLPGLLVLAALGAVRLFDAVRTRRWRVVMASLAAALLMGVFLAGNPPPREAYRRESAGAAHLDLGSYYAWRSQTDPAHAAAAETHFREAVRLRPQDADAARLLGSFLMERPEQRAEAGEHFRRAVALAPQDPGARLAYGEYLEAVGELEEAARELRQAELLNPARADVLGRLGQVLAQLNRPDDARPVMEQCLFLNPDDSETRHALGLLLGRRGAFAEAAEQFRAILARDPGHASAAGNLAIATARQRGAEAEPLLDSAP
jgi:Flp pilus assembly protein TadD